GAQREVHADEIWYLLRLSVDLDGLDRKQRSSRVAGIYCRTVLNHFYRRHLRVDLDAPVLVQLHARYLRFVAGRFDTGGQAVGKSVRVAGREDQSAHGCLSGISELQGRKALTGRNLEPDQRKVLVGILPKFKRFYFFSARSLGHGDRFL